MGEPMTARNLVLKGVLAIIVSSCLWGTTGTAASFAPDISALAIGAFAMGGGGVLLVLHARRTLWLDRATLWANPAYLWAGGLSVAVYPLAFYSSMRLSGVAVGTVVSLASAPLFAVILECLISKKSLSLRWCVSFAIAALGISLLVLGQHQETALLTSSSERTWGVLLGLVAGLSYATYSWAAKHMIEQGVQSRSAMSSMFGLAALVLLPSLGWTGDHLLASSVNISVALYMAVVPMFLGYLVFSYGLRHIEASKATLLTLIEPVVAMLLAVVVVGERFQWVGWFGMVLILLGLMLQVVRFPIVRKPQILSS